MEERYIPPHKRKQSGRETNQNGLTGHNGNNGNGSNTIRLTPNNHMFGKMNPNSQLIIYDMEIT